LKIEPLLYNVSFGIDTSLLFGGIMSEAVTKLLLANVCKKPFQWLRPVCIPIWVVLCSKFTGNWLPIGDKMFLFVYTAIVYIVILHFAFVGSTEVAAQLGIKVLKVKPTKKD